MLPYRTSVCLLAFLFFLCFMCCSPQLPPPLYDAGDGTDRPAQSGTCALGLCPEGQYCDAKLGCRDKCKSDKDCSAAKQLCKTIGGQCVDCLRQSDCQTGMTCRRFRCFKDSPCRSSKDCPNDQVCDLKEEKCVECLADGDCKTKQVCRQGICALEPVKCVSHKDCKSYGQVCDIKNAACVDCVGDNDCPETQYCKEQICTDDVCKAGETRCSDKAEAVIACNQAGGAWDEPKPCAANEFCKDGACQKQVCKPGEKTCEVGGVAVCNSRGSGFAQPAPCGADEYCDNGACQKQVCKPGEKTCENNTVKTCNAQGSGYDTKACAAKQFCEQGVCKDPVCVPQAKSCEDNKIRVCNEAGSGWNVTTDCGQDKFCENGVCIPKSCKPGEKLCAGNTIKTCDANGKGWQDTPCAAGEYCDKGSCLKTQCKAGDKQCKDSKTVQTCRVNGSGWDDKACGTGELCDQGQCRKQICIPSAATCVDAVTVQQCGPKGLTAQQKKCAAGEYCDKGVCNKQQCKPGVQECANSTTARTCQSNGSGWNVTPCQSGESCDQGQCKAQICTPNVTRCASALVAEACDAKGLNWIPQTCPTNSYCNQGKCVQGRCQEGQTQSCYAGPSGTQGKGLCKAGSQTCVQGKWTACLGQVLPAPTEECDTLDNDCDGQVDEGNACPTTPTLTSLEPDGWSHLCSTDVVLKGTNFSPASTVLFHNQLFSPAAIDPRYKLSYVSSTQLKLKFDPGLIGRGTFNVSVKNGPNAISQTLKFTTYYGVTIPPTINAIIPSAGAADTLVSVSVSYTQDRFLPGAVVELNGKPQPTTCVYNSGRDTCVNLKAVLDLAGLKPGTASVTVLNPCGYRSQAKIFTVQPPPQPFIVELDPWYAFVGDKKVVTIKGSNFSKGHSLLWNGVKLSSTYRSPQELATAQPVDFGLSTPGNISVQVDNNNGTKTKVWKLTVLAKTHTPVIDKLSVTQFEAGKFYPQVVVTGKGFVSTSQVYFNNVLVQSTYNSATQITIPLLDLTQTQAGLYDLYVKNGSTSSNLLPMHVQEASVSGTGPVLTRISPVSIYAGRTTAITVYGENLCQLLSRQCRTAPKLTITDSQQGDHSVKFTLTRTYGNTNTDNFVQGTLDATSMLPGIYTLVLENDQNQKTPPFHIVLEVAPPPTISVLSPSFIMVNTIATVNVKGTEILNGFKAYIATLSLATRYTNSTSSYITVDGTKLGAGVYSLYLQNPDGQKSNTVPFVVASSTQPVITRLSNSTIWAGWVYANFYVYGLGWSANPTFLVDGKTFQGSIASCSISSGTRESSCTLSNFSTVGLAPGSHTMQYSNSGTTSQTYPLVLVKAPGPELLSLSVSEVEKGGIATITISGRNFSSDAKALLGQQSFSTTYRNSSQLTLSLDTMQIAEGSYAVVIENPDKQRTNALTLDILPPKPPLIYYLTPDNISTSSRTHRLYGRNFDRNMTLSVDGNVVNYTYRSANEVQFTFVGTSTQQLYQIQLARTTNGLKSNVYEVLLLGSRPLITALTPQWVKSNQRAFVQFSISGLQIGDRNTYRVIVSGPGLSQPVPVSLHYPWGVELNTSGWTPGVYTLKLQNKITLETTGGTGLLVVK